MTMLCTTVYIRKSKPLILVNHTLCQYTHLQSQSLYTHLIIMFKPRYNHDILREILSWYSTDAWVFHRDGNEATRTQTLLNLSLVSVLFRNMALPILWFHMTSVMPLLELLSNFQPVTRDQEFDLELAREVNYVGYVCFL